MVRGGARRESERAASLRFIAQWCWLDEMCLDRPDHLVSDEVRREFWQREVTRLNDLEVFDAIATSTYSHCSVDGFRIETYVYRHVPAEVRARYNKGGSVPASGRNTRLTHGLQSIANPMQRGNNAASQQHVELRARLDTLTLLLMPSFLEPLSLVSQLFNLGRP